MDLILVKLFGCSPMVAPMSKTTTLIWNQRSIWNCVEIAVDTRRRFVTIYREKQNWILFEKTWTFGYFSPSTFFAASNFTFNEIQRCLISYEQCSSALNNVHWTSNCVKQQQVSVGKLSKCDDVMDRATRLRYRDRGET